MIQDKDEYSKKVIFLIVISPRFALLLFSGRAHSFWGSSYCQFIISSQIHHKRFSNFESSIFQLRKLTNIFVESDNGVDIIIIIL